MKNTNITITKVINERIRSDLDWTKGNDVAAAFLTDSKNFMWVVKKAGDIDWEKLEDTNIEVEDKEKVRTIISVDANEASGSRIASFFRRFASEQNQLQKIYYELNLKNELLIKKQEHPSIIFVYKFEEEIYLITNGKFTQTVKDEIKDREFPKRLVFWMADKRAQLTDTKYKDNFKTLEGYNYLSGVNKKNRTLRTGTLLESIKSNSSKIREIVTSGSIEFAGGKRSGVNDKESVMFKFIYNKKSIHFSDSLSFTLSETEKVDEVMAEINKIYKMVGKNSTYKFIDYFKQINNEELQFQLYKYAFDKVESTFIAFPEEELKKIEGATSPWGWATLKPGNKKSFLYCDISGKEHLEDVKEDVFNSMASRIDLFDNLKDFFGVNLVIKDVNKKRIAGHSLARSIESNFELNGTNYFHFGGNWYEMDSEIIKLVKSEYDKNIEEGIKNEGIEFKFLRLKNETRQKSNKKENKPAKNGTDIIDVKPRKQTNFKDEALFNYQLAKQITNGVLTDAMNVDGGASKLEVADVISIDEVGDKKEINLYFVKRGQSSSGLTYLFTQMIATKKSLEFSFTMTFQSLYDLLNKKETGQRGLSTGLKLKNYYFETDDDKKRSLDLIKSIIDTGGSVKINYIALFVSNSNKKTLPEMAKNGLLDLYDNLTSGISAKDSISIIREKWDEEPIEVDSKNLDLEKIFNY